MVPAIAEGGKSFKGAALYYLHDKREPGEAMRLTDNRVAWTQTVNLGTDNPETAWRIMAATAMRQDKLKADAGIKATGRKMTGTVFSYSLAWPPGYRPTKEEMLEAARDSLKVLALEEHQAIILEHTDEPHPHVHIIANRVHPETGRAATVSYSKLKLSQWAQDYEQKQGQIVCPQRVENNARRKQGEFVRSPRKPRPAYELEKAKTANDRDGIEFKQLEQKQKDASLHAQERLVRDSHAPQWEGLNRTYATVKTKWQAKTDKKKQESALEIKARAKGRWRDLFQRQREQRKIFDAAKRGFLSKLWSMAFVYRELRRENAKADALTILYTLLSSGQRRAVFDQAQENERRLLARYIRREVNYAAKDIDRDARRDFADLRLQYLDQCAVLRQEQGRQLAELKARWQIRNDERKQALGPIRERVKRMKQARHYRRGRSIKDDDLYRRPPQKPDPGQGNQGPKGPPPPKPWG
jgi:Relaxase/Mobilisation nuclease domain